MNCEELKEVLECLDDDEYEEFIIFLKKEVPSDAVWYDFYYHPFSNAFFGISVLISNKGDVVYMNYEKVFSGEHSFAKCLSKRRVEYYGVELNYEEDKHLIPHKILNMKQIVDIVDKRLLEKNNNLAPSNT